MFRAIAATPFAALLLGALLFAAAPRAEAQGAAEADAIQKVIRDQIAAMQEDDWNRAFSFASPNIRRIFRTPHNFSVMVMQGYPMVWRPRSFSAGAIRPASQGPIQTMLFEDLKGRLFVADYYMILVDGEWRIDGVEIRPAPEGTA